MEEDGDKPVGDKPPISPKPMSPVPRAASAPADVASPTAIVPGTATTNELSEEDAAAAAEGSDTLSEVQLRSRPRRDSMGVKITPNAPMHSHVACHI